MEYELPQGLRELLTEQYGEETAETIVQGFMQPRRVTLRVNTIKTSVDAARAQLEAAGVALTPVAWSDEAFIVENVREHALEQLPLYENGDIYLQSLSSMLPPLLLEPQAGECILDMAAAPGGKTTQMAALSGNRALITACEMHKIRAQRLEYNVKKQGASRVNVMVTDSRRLDDLFQFDKILLDAPCSVSGTILYTDKGFTGGFSRALMDKCARTQEEMLRKALRLLKPGHEMVYSTCSILQRENEAVLQRVLKNGAAQVVPFDEARFADVPKLPTGMEGALLVRPTQLYEGFFAVRLRKSGEAKKSKRLR